MTAVQAHDSTAENAKGASKKPVSEPDKITCHICQRHYPIIPHFVRGYCPHCGVASRP